MLQVRLLLAELEVEPDESIMLTEIQEPRLKSAESDLKAYIYKQGDEQPLWSSPSAALVDGLRESESYKQHYTALVRQSSLGTAVFKKLGSGFALAYTVVFETEEVTASGAANASQRSSPYTLLVLDNGAEFSRQIAIFQRTLMLGLGLGILVFLCIQFFVLRWIFRPLGTLEAELEDIERGATERFSSRYPGELLPLTERLNLFFETERVQRKRYKNTLSDLAHSIKTPLAVIRSLPALEQTEDGRAVLGQVARMEQIVGHQLRRSVLPAEQSSAHQTDVVVVINRVLDSLHKIYSEKSIDLSINLPDELWIRMPEDDLFEVMGNLLDNAFKYCQSAVEVFVEDSGDSFASQPDKGFACAQITIANDGQSVKAVDIERIVERGVRFDEMADGHGLGLSVARSIVIAYGGSLDVSAQRQSCLSVRVTVPI